MSGAFVDEPAAAEPKGYRANVKALGHEPGEEFEATLDPAQEARLLASGALSLAGEPEELPTEQATPEGLEVAQQQEGADAPPLPESE